MIDLKFRDCNWKLLHTEHVDNSKMDDRQIFQLENDLLKEHPDTTCISTLEYVKAKIGGGWECIGTDQRWINGG